MSAFSRYAIDTRPIDALTPAQIGLILGLEQILDNARLVLLCPRCAEDHQGLQTQNSPEDEVWKIDCQCRRRRVNRAGSSPMPATGWLLTMVEELLKPLSLDVRCPSPSCLLTPLTLTQSPGALTVTCRCSATRKFKKRTSHSKPH